MDGATTFLVCNIESTSKLVKTEENDKRERNRGKDKEGRKERNKERSKCGKSVSDILMK